MPRRGKLIRAHDPLDAGGDLGPREDESVGHPERPRVGAELGRSVGHLREETGIEVEPTRLVGIYSDPNRVVEYSDGEVRQQFSVCIASRPVGGELSTSDESVEVGYFSPDAIEGMAIHESIRRRIRDYLAGDSTPVID